jgi:hypothetical protein
MQVASQRVSFVITTQIHYLTRNRQGKTGAGE